MGIFMKLSDRLLNIPIQNVESILIEHLQTVDFIGQVDIDESSYRQLMEKMRDHYSLDHLKRGTIPPALFLISMVFSARYNGKQSRNFWELYAIIWKKSLDSNFQKWCREHFDKSSRDLSKRLGFDFPKKTTGDLVRPIYYQALIPAHLKDDFASWLNQQLSDFLKMDTEQIENELSDRIQFVAPTLQHFLTNSDSQPAALTLIAEMLDCVRLYKESGDQEDISSYLSSIIEREIWSELLKNIQIDNLPATRTLQPKIEWVWELDSGQMFLRIRDIVSSSEFEPYYLVRTNPNQSIQNSLMQERIRPWRKPDGTWYIDEYTIDDVDEHMVGCKILIVNRDDHLIQGLSIPPLPDDDIVFCRTTQQYAIPVAKSTSYLSTDWVVLLKENSHIDAQLERLPKPDLLEAKYAKALHGYIQFPVNIRIGDETKSLDSKNFFVIHAELSGKQLQNISSKVPTTFTDTQLNLILNASLEQIKKLKLQIEQDGRIIKRLRLSQVDVHEQGNSFSIDLSPYLEELTGRFAIDIIRGKSSVFNYPIQFNVLPQIEILEKPFDDIVYHPDNLPHILVKGITPLTRIQGDENSVVITQHSDDTVKITWSDLRNAFCFITIDGIQLRWDIQRVWAWLEHKDLKEITSIEDLSNSSLFIRGLREQEIKINVNNSKYNRKLNATGQFNTLIKNDRLNDLLDANSSSNIRLGIDTAYGNWILWERLGSVSIVNANTNIPIHYDSFSKIVEAKVNLSYQLKGRFEYRLLSTEETLAVGYHNSLQLTDTLNIQIPISLKQGQYQLVLYYRGAKLEDKEDCMIFDVVSLAQNFLQKRNPLSNQERLELLSLRSQEFDELGDQALKEHWRLLEFITRARKKNVYLPAWAITENTLTCNIIFSGAVKQITLYPELVLHRGLSGIGKTPITVNDEKKYAYVHWKSSSKTRSEIRLWLPKGSPKFYWELKPDDMYPVYYSKRYLEFYAKEGYPTQQEIREKDLIEVSHEDSLPCEIYSSQRFLQHSLKPHNVVDRNYFIAKLKYNDKYQSKKPNAESYRKAIDNFLEIEKKKRKEVLSFLNPNSKYRIILEKFETRLASHTIIGNTLLRRVTYRFIQSALVWSDNEENHYLDLERFVMLVALALRLRAYYPHLSQEIDALIPKTDLIELVLLVEGIAPKLFIWSLTWVERFAIHAIS
jgi:hypothetical protein